MNVNQFSHPVVALGMCFEVSCLGHPKKYLEEMGEGCLLFVLGSVLFFEINRQLVFCVI